MRLCCDEAPRRLMACRLHRLIASQRRLRSAGLFKAILGRKQRHRIAGQGFSPTRRSRDVNWTSSAGPHSDSRRRDLQVKQRSKRPRYLSRKPDPDLDIRIGAHDRRSIRPQFNLRLRKEDLQCHTSCLRNSLPRWWMPENPRSSCRPGTPDPRLYGRRHPGARSLVCRHDQRQYRPADRGSAVLSRRLFHALSTRLRPA